MKIIYNRFLPFNGFAAINLMARLSTASPRFSPEEIETQNNALNDIGSRLSSVNVSA